MSTTKSTNTQNQYDPGSLNQYQQNQNAWAPTARGFATNPYGNSQFQFESQLGNRNAQQQNQTNVNQLLQNQTASGYGGGSQSPFMQEMMANQMRAGTANMAQQGFINPTQLANQRQQNSLGMLASYQPLQTGQTQTQKTSGLGTWLPQAVNAGVGLAAAPFTGGMSLAGAAGLGSQFGSTGASNQINSLLNQNMMSPGMAGLAGNNPFLSSGSSSSGYGGFGNSGWNPWEG